MNGTDRQATVLCDLHLGRLEPEILAETRGLFFRYFAIDRARNSAIAHEPDPVLRARLEAMRFPK